MNFALVLNCIVLFNNSSCHLSCPRPRLNCQVSFAKGGSSWPSVTIGWCDPGPLSLCVRFQAISPGGIVNGPVSQLWRTTTSQYLLFGAVKWSNINHELFIEIDWKCSQITDHPGCWGWVGTLLTHSRLARVSLSGVWWSLCIIGHCHQDSLFPITMLFLIPIPPLLPEFLGSPLAPLAAPLAGAGRRSLGSDSRLKPNSS